MAWVRTSHIGVATRPALALVLSYRQHEVLASIGLAKTTKWTTPKAILFVSLSWEGIFFPDRLVAACLATPNEVAGAGDQEGGNRSRERHHLSWRPSNRFQKRDADLFQDNTAGKSSDRP